MGLASKRVVITGASRGIGAELARRYAADGALVALLSLDLPGALSDELRAAGAAGVLSFEVDVTDAGAMASAAGDILARWGEVDLVVANAGIGGLNPANAFDPAIDRRFFEINYFGQVNTFSPFVGSMIQRRKGHLVGISSLAAFRGLPQAASYSASKAAQHILLESWRVDLRPFGVRVSCIHPGFVRTQMARHSMFRMPFMVDPAEAARKIHRAIALGRAHYLFPWPMRVLTTVNRMLPDWLYDRVIRRAARPDPATTPRIF
jgi:NAD(P)-dependent dehydrogenase (short-subunit alcohol dehydrogenase family)